MKEALLLAVGLVILCASMLWAVNEYSRKQCKARWENSGYDTRYSFIGGCLISADGKRWIPGDALREVK